MAGKPAGSFIFHLLDGRHSVQNSHNGKVVNKCIQLVIGLKIDGLKEILGMWLNETERASFLAECAHRF